MKEERYILFLYKRERKDAKANRESSKNVKGGFSGCLPVPPVCQEERLWSFIKNALTHSEPRQVGWPCAVA